MKDKQLIYLFLANFTIYIIGMGLFPVLPLYAGDFGASAGLIGVYMALAYIAITVGSLAVGWIPDNITRKSAFVVVGAIGVPALILLGQATGFWQIVLLTAIVWFSGGVGTSLTSVFTGVVAEEGDRGRLFSIMFLAKPLAGIVGGFLVAWLVEWGGYTPTFNVMAAIWAIMPIIGLIGLPNDKSLAGIEAQSEMMVEGISDVGDNGVPLTWQFNILLVMLLLATIAAYSSRLGISLSLIELNFDASDAASVAISSSLITLPLVPMIGSLSDRLGRHRFLIIGSLMATAGSLVLLAADQLWQFWLSGGLLLASMTVTATVASAMGTDLLTAKALNRGLPRLSAMTWAAGIIGFLGAGYLVESVGTETLYIGAIIISMLASALVLELRPKPLFLPAAMAAHLPTRPYDQCLDEATEFTVPCSELV